MLNQRHDQRKEFLENCLIKTYDVDGIDLLDFTTFNTSNAVVWIDPLDGTSDFVKGNLQAVTVLIGLAINGYSKIGIVHNVFSDEDETKGRTMFGTMEHGVFRLYYDDKLSEIELASRVPEYLEPFD
mmetsp:Transcript_43816/g.42310  ORF Transcript_43816/g.42310 Transcript_43816/m.42310 type:complete len:127 (+) Transcript_43816:340-720(+)